MFFSKNYINVQFEADDSICNTIVNVKITDANEHTLFGVID